MNNWHTGRLDDKNNIHLPDAFIVANFPPSKEGQPSLLRHDDVHTLFHEAGHAIHHLFSKCKESDVSGINGVEWDAVEFPSQFLENFAYEEKVLKLFARHYETGEMIPDELIKKLIDNKNFQSGMFLVRQLEFGIFDLSIYDTVLIALPSCRRRRTDSCEVCTDRSGEQTTYPAALQRTASLMPRCLQRGC